MAAPIGIDALAQALVRVGQPASRRGSR
jgi:hypothetical protein